MATHDHYSSISSPPGTQDQLSSPVRRDPLARRLFVLTVITLVSLFLVAVLSSIRSPHARPRGIGNVRWGWSDGLVLGKDCWEADFVSRTLKLVDEAAFAGLMGGGLDGDKTRFEASGLCQLPQDGGTPRFLVVFDNMWDLGLVDMAGRSGLKIGAGRLVKWDGKKRTRKDPDFEAVATDGQGTLLVVQEMQKIQGSYRPVIWEVDLISAKNKSRIKVNEKCIGDFVFSHGNKGFEGAEVLKDADGVPYLLGLCEGNFCFGGWKGRQVGNGRIVVMKRVQQKGKCRYKTVDMIQIPPSANFIDYSDMAVRGNKLAIVSQESAAMWVGTFRRGKQGRFMLDDGKVFDFPRNDECLVKYCNIEGVQWITDNFIAAVSDKMKGRGKQNFRCLEKDQMIHTFALPN